MDGERLLELVEKRAAKDARGPGDAVSSLVAYSLASHALIYAHLSTASGEGSAAVDDTGRRSSPDKTAGGQARCGAGSGFQGSAGALSGVALRVKLSGWCPVTGRSNAGVALACVRTGGGGGGMSCVRARARLSTRMRACVAARGVRASLRARMRACVAAGSHECASTRWVMCG